jgi:hypothetical protein
MVLPSVGMRSTGVLSALNPSFAKKDGERFTRGGFGPVEPRANDSFDGSFSGPPPFRAGCRIADTRMRVIGSGEKRRIQEDIAVGQKTGSTKDTGE